VAVCHRVMTWRIAAVVGGCDLWFCWYGFNPGRRCPRWGLSRARSGSRLKHDTGRGCGGRWWRSSFRHPRAHKWGQRVIRATGFLPDRRQSRVSVIGVLTFGAICIGAIAGASLILVSTCRIPAHRRTAIGRGPSTVCVEWGVR